jgi:purine-binding chemotaxis protein CheW
VTTTLQPQWRASAAAAEGVDLVQRLHELRAAFDASFADPPREEVAGHDDLLAIRAGGRRYALRLTQAAGLFPDRPVTRLPGPVSALLGVAGFRGAIVPVYGLAAVFGIGGTAAAVNNDEAGRPRWLVLAAGTPSVALAFDELDGHLRVPSDVLVEEAAGHGPHGCLRGIVPLGGGSLGGGSLGGGSLGGGSLGGGSLPIVDVPAVRAAVQAAVGRWVPPAFADAGDTEETTAAEIQPPPATEGA